MIDRTALAPPRPPLSDVTIAVALALAGAAEVLLVSEIDAPATLPFVLGISLPLAWRRTAPLAAALLVLGSELAMVIGSTPVTSIDAILLPIPAFVIALYSLGAHTALVRAATGLGIALAVVWFSIFANEGPGVENLAFGLVVVSAPWLAGRMVRRRTEQAVALALRAQDLERSQAEREAAAVAEERTRIARELHDIIAHSVSVMTIQAGAVEEVLDSDPEKARAAAGSIRHTGRQALVDLRRLLGLLREQDADPEGLVPQPGLADLDGLINQVRSAGIEIKLDVEGTPRPLPPAVDLSAFRLVQEALTNTLKHARASTAVVGVRYAADALHIEVVDDGVGGNGAGKGHGLVGMRERIALYGGKLEYGRRSNGGFRVHALLPVDGEAV